MTADLASSSVPLQSALHDATRSKHASLNKTIIARLPLCIPPYTSDPTAYYLGMLTFGHIYLGFEQAIADLLHDASLTDEPVAPDTILQILHTEGLQRSEVLKQDLEILSTRLQARNPGIENIETTVRNQAVETTSHIFRNIESKPYLALAYTWTMYLALFNGGRWLYKQLEAAGPDFWLESMSEEEDSDGIQALSFWRFDTSPQDPNAEQLKLEFKSNFEQASDMLNTKERDEVVEEAVGLFDLCLNLIGDLDTVMVELNQDTQQTSSHVLSATGLQPDADTISSVWQTVSSLLLAPAYRVLNSSWMRPVKGDIKAVG